MAISGCKIKYNACIITCIVSCASRNGHAYILFSGLILPPHTLTHKCYYINTDHTTPIIVLHTCSNRTAV